MEYYASYFKCALQVNPSSYASYRGEPVSEEVTYNNEILKKCRDNGISIVGLANHGNVDSSENLRRLLNESGITVFPGFEIMSAEKVHMVCLFPEDRSISQLNRYLGAMGLGTAERGNETSSLTCLQIAQKVSEAGGFWYAAHITGDNGILKIGKLNTVWQSNLLVAAQIPDSTENVDPRYKNIINNTDPQYKRTKPPAYINACDIDKPEDLDKESATTLIKMTTPSFQNFVMAFKDPESRIRLNSEIENGYQSILKKMNVYGGYLDGLEIDFSDNLVTIIGGRGTGKSTIINFIRYALNIFPKDKSRRKDFDDMIDHNLGSAARIELVVESNAQFGITYTIIRRYKAEPVVQDSEGNVSSLKVSDILPKIEIYGQNEIVESVRNPEWVNSVVLRLLSIDPSVTDRIKEAYAALDDNSSEIAQLESDLAVDETQSADLPMLQEKLSFYKKAEIDSKLTVIKQLTAEESIFDQFKEIMPISPPSLSPLNIELRGDNEVAELQSLSNEYNRRLESVQSAYSDLVQWIGSEYAKIRDKWETKKEEKDDEIRDALSNISGIQDKTSTEIVTEYTNLLKRVNQAEPVQKRIEKNKTAIQKLSKRRNTLIELCRKSWDEYASDVAAQVKKINKSKLKGVVRLSVKYRQQKDALLAKLKTLDGIGDKSISGIAEYEDLDAFTFADDIRKGMDWLKNKYHLTSATAEKIVSEFTPADIRFIEGFIFPDQFVVELCVNGKYKQMQSLSKGQQCTAILHVVLLENKDPLIIDQPEDNLDNSFIAEDLIAAIRENKIKRQYIFATHNANIPVFGDAELIVSMEENEGMGIISKGGIGSIDTDTVKDHVVRILEGGEAAFRMREEKYGLKS